MDLAQAYLYLESATIFHKIELKLSATQISRNYPNTGEFIENIIAYMNILGKKMENAELYRTIFDDIGKPYVTYMSCIYKLKKMFLYPTADQLYFLRLFAKGFDVNIE